MPAWGRVLTGQEIANVGEYVYRAFLRPDAPAAMPGWQPGGGGEEPAKKN